MLPFAVCCVLQVEDEQALAIQREVGDRRNEGTTLNNPGEVARERGQLEEAQAYYEQSLAIRREVGDRTGEGTTFNNLGLVAHARDKLAEALAYYKQALTISREVGDRRVEGTTLINLGALARSWPVGGGAALFRAGARDCSGDAVR